MAQCRVPEVLTFVSDWFKRHMAMDYLQPDAVSPRGFVPYDQQISPQFVQYGQMRPQQPHRNLQRPLRYQCVEIINDRRYFLQLEKRHHDFALLNFGVTCLDQSNQPNLIDYDATYYDQSGYYSMVLETPADCQYVTSFRATRLSST